MTRPPTKRPAFALSHADNKRAIQASLKAHETMSGRQTPVEQTSIATARPKQVRKAAGSDGRRLESDVQREIIAYLLKHPAVAMVERINSGAVYGAENQFIRFHHLMIPLWAKLRFGAMRVVDLNVMMGDGRRLAIECKRGDWSKPTGEREREQQQYLRCVSICGGIGIFACSVDDVRVALVAAGYAE